MKEFLIIFYRNSDDVNSKLYFLINKIRKLFKILRLYNNNLIL